VRIVPFATVKRGQSLYPAEKLVWVNVSIFAKNGITPVKNVRRQRLVSLANKKKLVSLVSRKKLVSLVSRKKLVSLVSRKKLVSLVSCKPCQQEEKSEEGCASGNCPLNR